MKPLPPDDEDKEEEDEGFTISPADVTSRIRVDPWTGQVIPEFPHRPPRPLLRPRLRPDPDRTNEVEIDPETGRVVPAGELRPRLTFGHLGPNAPELATLEIPNPEQAAADVIAAADNPQEKTREIDIRPYQAQMAVEPEPSPWLRPIEPTPAGTPLPLPPSTPPPARSSSPAPLRATSSPPPPRQSTPPPVRPSSPAPLRASSQPPPRQSTPPPVPLDALASRPPDLGGDAPVLHPPLSHATPVPLAPPPAAEGFAPDGPWALARPDDLGAGPKRTLGMRLVAIVAFLALAVGASLGIAMTIILVGGDEAADAGPEVRSPVEPRANDAGPAKVAPADLGRVVEPPPPAVDAAPPPVPEKLTSLDAIVLPITFPRNGFDPERIDTERLKQIANLMVKDRSLEVDVVGYAAVDEEPAAIERLASRRAKLAASLLSSYGPSRSRFAVRSGGASVEHGRSVVLRIRRR